MADRREIVLEALGNRIGRQGDMEIRVHRNTMRIIMKLFGLGDWEFGQDTSARSTRWRSTCSATWLGSAQCLETVSMADTIDEANALTEQHLERSLRAARQPIAAGVPGECEECGYDMPRLVDGRCGFCRDGRRR